MYYLKGIFPSALFLTLLSAPLWCMEMTMDSKKSREEERRIKIIKALQASPHVNEVCLLMSARVLNEAVLAQFPLDIKKYIMNLVLSLWVETALDCNLNLDLGCSFKLSKTFITASAFDPLLSGSISSDGKTIIVGSAKGKIYWLDTTTQELTNNGRIYWLDGITEELLTEEILTKFKAYNGPVLSVALSTDNTTILTGSDKDRMPCLWSAETGEFIKELIGHPTDVTSVGFSSDSKTIITGSLDGKVYAYSVQEGKISKKGAYEIELRDDSEETFSRVVVNPNSMTAAVLTVSEDEGIGCLWDIEMGMKESKELRGHYNKKISVVAFSFDGTTVATGSWNDRVCLWSVETASLIIQFKTIGFNSLRSIALSQDGGTVLTGSSDGTVGFWCAKTGKLITKFKGSPSPVLVLAVSPNGKTILTVLENGQVCLWRKVLGEVIIWILSKANRFQVELIRRISQENESCCNGGNEFFNRGDEFIDDEGFCIYQDSPEAETFFTMPDFVQDYLQKSYRINFL